MIAGKPETMTLPAKVQAPPFVVLLNSTDGTHGDIPSGLRGRTRPPRRPNRSRPLHEHIEDQRDIEAAREALREPGDDIPYKKVRDDLGL